MFEFHKKEKPLLSLSSFGGGAGGFAFGGAPLIIQATGGSAGGGAGITPGDGYRYFVFTSPGPNPWVVTQGAQEVEYIIVAGGGGGASASYGAGGGAGGMLKVWPGPLFTGPATARNVGPAFPVAPGTYDIVIGDGGAGGLPPTPGGQADGSKGQNSTISGPTIATITAIGGGGGNDNQSGVGNPGGSGGGGGEPYLSKPGGTGYNVGTTAQQGFPGGNGSPPTAPISLVFVGGGGGSAYPGSGGWDGPYPVATPQGASRGGDGDGFGGIPASYGTPGPNPTFRYFAGGGGGASGSAIVSGGYGGGGLGSRRFSTPVGTSGATNTGGGGGGGADGTPEPTYYGKQGGSGIVIIRCLAA